MRKRGVERVALAWLTTLAAGLGSLAAWAQSPPSPRFEIRRFVVDGNTLLSAAEVERATAPHRGGQRDFGDIQRALEALESAYRARGYSAVAVQLPEQEVTDGEVRFKVIEARIARIEVAGNRHFSTPNVLAALPSLMIGSVPNARAMSESIQLSNENPARQSDVVLSVGEKEGELDVKVNVTDERPWRAFATVDNTGNSATGQLRAGLALQHANLFDRDHLATLAYTGSPSKPAGTQVDIWSVGYRVPFYRFGDSLDLVYAKSTIGTPSSSPALGGTVGIIGRGSVGSVRWNHLFARDGEYSSRLVAALDYRDMKSACVDNTGAPLIGVAGCVDYLVVPVSLTYAARIDSPARVFAYSVGAAANAAASDSQSYDLASSNRRAPRSFGILRLTANLVQAVAGDWQLRANLNAQSTPQPLVPTEQIGLAGSTAVRGFTERAFAADRGYVVQVEAHTPDLAAFAGWAGNLRLLGFVDAAGGSNINQPFDSPSHFGLASSGVGARYQLRRDVAWRFDLAYVQRAPAVSNGGPMTDAKWRAHFGLTLGF